MVLGVLRGLLRRSGSHTPLGNFSSKRGNKNFYKGRGGKKYGIPGAKGAPRAIPLKYAQRRGEHRVFLVEITRCFLHCAAALIFFPRPCCVCAGGFVLRGLPNYFMPDLTDFRLKPYVWPGEGLTKTNVLETPEKS